MTEPRRKRGFIPASERFPRRPGVSVRSWTIGLTLAGLILGASTSCVGELALRAETRRLLIEDLNQAIETALETELQLDSAMETRLRNIEKQQLTEQERKDTNARVLTMQQLATGARAERDSYTTMRGTLLSPWAWMYTRSYLEDWRARMAVLRKSGADELEVAKGLNQLATEESKAQSANTEPSP